ncbi:amidohydrolase [Streptosporangium sp. NBC_01756]|uniref:amidohydrolase n=1 Tax=Streptosporangium sp. NBC_01756 TaxID=2975950 RepID=UPI002DDA462C|nr:amidohydrolase [Streptosporangium sp. NBC_01756]WSC89313.1 amidohydrolase [Streptosporangium sp. NBC_01756]
MTHHTTTDDLGGTPVSGASAEIHERIAEEIGRLSDDLIGLSLDLHAHPETAMNEKYAAGRLTEMLHRDFTVEEGLGGLPTAFRGTAGSGAPVLAFLCEYDALPGIGHGCGHNLIAAGGIGAAIALRRAAPELPGTVSCIGTPGEEGAGGKVLLLEAGAFDGVDAALMFHPGDTTMPIRHATATRQLVLEFHGVAAHAAASAQDGRSALAAVIQFFTGVDALRQFVPESSRLHGIITHGGEAPNVVPAYTRAEFMVRALTGDVVDDLVGRVEAIAAAAAAATGTTVQISRGLGYSERKNNHVIAGLVAGHLRRQGVRVEQPVLRGGTGSSDIGNVSLVLPTVHPYLQVMDSGTPTHSLAMTEAVARPRAQQAMLRMATALACAGADLLADPELFDAVRAEFATRGPDLPA